MNNVTYQPTLCVGADVHLDEIVLRAVDKALGHEVHQRFCVTNNLPGAQEAAATIAAAATELGYTRIEIACEATGMLWIPFHRYLSTAPPLQPFELELVCFNPKLVAKFKDGLVLRSPKDDDRDAFDVAARLRFGELPISYVPSDFWQGLRRLTRYRYRLSKAMSREKMRFQSHAFLKCSDWKRVKAFSDIFGATSVALLTEFTVAELQEMTHDQLVDLITHRGHGRFADPTATARAVREALRSSYPIDPRMDEMVTATLAAGWDYIRSAILNMTLDAVGILTPGVAPSSIRQLSSNPRLLARVSTRCLSAICMLLTLFSPLDIAVATIPAGVWQPA